MAGAIVPKEGYPLWFNQLRGYNGLTAFLFTDDVTPDADTVLADLTPAESDGLAGRVFTWGELSYDEDGNPQAFADEWLVGFDGDTEESLYGWAVKGEFDGEEVLLLAYRFEDAPWVIDEDFLATPLYLRFTMIACEPPPP